MRGRGGAGRCRQVRAPCVACAQRGHNASLDDGTLRSNLRLRRQFLSLLTSIA